MVRDVRGSTIPQAELCKIVEGGGLDMQSVQGKLYPLVLYMYLKRDTHWLIGINYETLPDPHNICNWMKDLDVTFRLPLPR